MKQKKKRVACIDPVKRDNHLWNTYGRTLKEYEDQDRKQKGCCAICKRPPKNLPLAQDHWHKLAKLKIKAIKLESGFWKAFNIEFKQYKYHLKEGALRAQSRNRKKAVKMVRLALKQKANRGLLCWRCNTGLKKWEDNPEAVQAAAEYLRYYQLRRNNG